MLMNRMNYLASSLCALYCLSGCSGPQRSADSPAGGQGAVASPIGVSVQGWVVTPEAPQGRALRNEDALGEGDQFSLRVQLAAPAYLYVLQASPTGLVPLFPVHGHRQVAAGQSLRIPEDPALSLPVNPRGRGERFLLLASPQPLSGEACTALGLGCGAAVSQTRGGDEQNKGNTQEPDKRGDRFLIDTTSPPPESATILTYRIAPHPR